MSSRQSSVVYPVGDVYVGKFANILPKAISEIKSLFARIKFLASADLLSTGVGASTVIVVSFV